MFRFWIREIFGWLLVFAGLGIFGLTLLMLLQERPSILEAPAVVIVGIIVFRGGIHLLKVAVAARVCMQARVEAPKVAAETSVTRAANPWDW